MKFQTKLCINAIWQKNKNAKITAQSGINFG